MQELRAVVREVLEAAEARALCMPSAWQSACSLLVSWGIIAGSFVLCALAPTVWAYALATILIGGRQLALAILMHEAAHRSLFASRRANDFFGTWLCAAPTWNHLAPYRTHHLEHHRHTGSADDPDLCLVTPFPTTRVGLARKLLRDLSGVSGLRRIVGLLAVDLGYMTYTASGGSQPVRPSLPRFARVRLAVSRLGPVALTNAALFGVLAWSGHAGLYGIWALAYLTTFSLFLRIRAMAEHAAVPDPHNPLQQTRTTHAGLLARLTVAPHHVNYHLEHHLLMGVPQYRLPALHRLLTERHLLDGACVEPGYGAVLRKLSTQDHAG
jgi:fatty acid desaturase